MLDWYSCQICYPLEIKILLLLLSVLWPKNNVNPNVYSTDSIRCPFGYSTGPC